MTDTTIGQEHTNQDKLPVYPMDEFKTANLPGIDSFDMPESLEHEKSIVRITKNVESALVELNERIVRGEVCCIGRTSVISSKSVSHLGGRLIKSGVGDYNQPTW